MKAKVIGIQDCQGTSKKTGKPYQGHNLHVVYDDNRVQGQAVTSVYVPDKIHDCRGIAVGADYEFIYETNFKGYSNLVDIVPVA